METHQVSRATRRAPRRVSDSEGGRTLQAALDEAVPAPVISTALYARVSSRDQAEYADKLLSALCFGFGNPIEEPTG
jgi:6-phosphogluconate dehydrogenase